MRPAVGPLALALFAPHLAAQSQLALLPQPGAAEDVFGQAVGLGAQYALVGAPRFGFPVTDDGSAVVFDVQTGAVVREIAGASVWTAFGTSVAVEGALGAIGAPGSDQGQPNTGVAFVYDLATGDQVVRFTPNDASGSDYLGTSIAIDGGRVLVGAAGVGGKPGKAYLFDALTATELAQFAPADLSPGDRFGVSVALDGNFALIGADRQGGVGAAYAIDVTTGQVLRKWTPTSGFANAGFGEHVALDGDVAVVGARWEHTSGRVHVYSVASGQELLELQPPPELGTHPWFGASVAASGVHVAVGASLADTAYGNESGAVFVYDVLNPGAPQVLHAAAGSFADNHGVSLAMRDDALLAGCPGAWVVGFQSGAAVLHDLSGAANSGAGGCFADPLVCGCDSVQGPTQGCGNSTRETGAALVGAGDASLAQDDFRLQVSGLPGAQPTLLLRGALLLNGGNGTPVGDGLLCTAGQVARSQVQTSASGVTTFADFQGQPFGATSYGAGVPTHYQAWYRDTDNECSGLGFNFSNAWTVTWQP